jgi:hypothetical protein
MDQREAERQVNWHVNGPERSRKTRELTCEWAREKQKEKRIDAWMDQKLKQKDKRIDMWMDQREAERQENWSANKPERIRKTRGLTRVQTKDWNRKARELARGWTREKQKDRRI